MLLLNRFIKVDMFLSPLPLPLLLKKEKNLLLCFLKSVKNIFEKKMFAHQCIYFIFYKILDIFNNKNLFFIFY